MKLHILCDQTTIEMEVTEEEIQVMIDSDLHLRQRNDPDARPRSIHEIVETELNAPERSTHRRHRDHNYTINTPTRTGDDFADLIPSNTGLAERIRIGEEGLDEEILDTMEAERTSQALVSALQALTKSQRELIEALYRDRVPANEIAASDGVSKSAVTGRKRRALEALRRELSKRGVNSLPARRLRGDRPEWPTPKGQNA